MMADGRPSPVRAENLRRANLALVLDHLRRHGAASRSRLVVATGLTRSTIGTLVEELVGLGLATEQPPAPDGSPGRPSPVVHVDTSHFAVLSVDIGVDEIGVAVVALDGSVLRSGRLVRSRDRVPLETTVSDIVDLTARLGVDGSTVAGRSLVSVGVAVPGLVRQPDFLVASAPNLGWSDVALGDLLAERLGCRVPVKVGNEADLGALAEARFGAGVGADHMVYVHGEVGVGGGLIVSGRPITGHCGYGGEIGHFPVNPEGSSCRCGSLGCWETEVGEPALLRRAELDADGGRAEVDRLLRLARQGSPVALAALEDQGRWMGIGISGLINVFDPDVVVLGGLFAGILPAVRAAMDDELERRRFRAVDRIVPVVAASLGVDVTFIGAAELGFADLLADPARMGGS
jgi:predicted NBD/HSP70 family sugar kinase